MFLINRSFPSRHPTTVLPGNSFQIKTLLAATPTDAGASLSWSASTGAVTYNLKRSTTSGGPYVIIASPITPGYTDTSTVVGQTYYYVVTSVNATGESTDSAEITLTDLATDTPTMPVWALAFLALLLIITARRSLPSRQTT